MSKKEVKVENNKPKIKANIKKPTVEIVKGPFIEKNKNIFIKFDEMFHDPELEIHNKFVMTIGKKRVYAYFAQEMCRDNNTILSLNSDIANKVLYSYFAIKKAIDTQLFVKVDTEDDLKKYGTVAKRDFGKYENFINFLITNLFTPDLVNLIKEYVNNTYKMNVDEKESEKYASSTTFTNEHFKLFYVISIMSKFAIPLCTHYIYVNSDKTIEVYNFMYMIFNAIFKIAVVESNCSDLMSKLYQYIDKIVKRTQNTNKLIWQSFPMYNDTGESIVDDLVVKIVTTIIPRFSPTQSIIALITVVARDSVMLYKIRAKNPYDCYRINDNDNSNDDEDKLSESDIFDMFYRNTDESILILNRYANDDAIDCICKRNNIYITDTEIQYYLKNYELHNLTVLCVSSVFARFFSGVNNVKSCTFEQFVKLMIVLVHKMYDLGIEYLPHFITAKRESYSFTRLPSIGILKSLKNNKDYVDLIELKYRHVKSIFDIKTGTSNNKNPIKDLIVSLIHNNYVYNEFNGKFNGETIQIDENMIVNDVLQLYKKMIL